MEVLKHQVHLKKRTPTKTHWSKQTDLLSQHLFSKAQTTKLLHNINQNTNINLWQESYLLTRTNIYFTKKLYVFPSPARKDLTEFIAVTNRQIRSAIRMKLNSMSENRDSDLIERFLVTSQLHWLLPLAPTHLWFLTCECQVNLLSHTPQLYAFSSVWTAMCTFRFAFFVNRLPQRKQMNGFSPVWILMCVTNVQRRLKLVLQTEQVKGFSPVWTLKWVVRFELFVNLLPQNEHRNVFASAWHLVCLCRYWLEPNVLPHWEQLNSFLPVSQPVSVRVCEPDWGSIVSFQWSSRSSASVSKQESGSFQSS